MTSNHVLLIMKFLWFLLLILWSDICEGISECMYTEKWKNLQYQLVQLVFFLHCAIFFWESGSWNARMEKSNDYSTSLSKLACCSCLTNTALSCIPANVASLLILLLPPHYFVLPTTSVYNYCISVSIYMQNNHWINYNILEFQKPDLRNNCMQKAREGVIPNGTNEFSLFTIACAVTVPANVIKSVNWVIREALQYLQWCSVKDVILLLQ